MVNHLRARNSYTWLASLGCLLLGVGYLLAPPHARAQQLAKPTGPMGELSAARQATVNGAGAISGQTLYDGSRVRTAAQGAATLNFGKRGRIQVGSATDLTLRLSATALGGGLNAGRVVLSAPAGMGISVTTPKGVITAEGRQSTVLTIEVEGDQARVATHQGEVKVTTGDKTERLTAGEELTLAPPGRDGGAARRGLVTAGMMGSGSALSIARAAQVAGQVARPVVASTQGASTFATLVNVGVNYSITRVLQQRRDPAAIFETTVTCRDTSSPLCQRISTVTP